MSLRCLAAPFSPASARSGASVAVVGLGGVGLASLLAARAAGARHLVAVDLSADKLALATSLGARHVFAAGRADVVEAIKQATAGGVDTAIEMAGSVAALELAYRITRRGGTTVTAGLPPPNATWSLSPVNLVGEERTIKGSYIGTCVPSRDLPRYIELYQRGLLPVNKLMSARLKLEEINLGFERLHDGEAVRQVVVFD
jgi:alcohol dehydrogenase